MMTNRSMPSCTVIPELAYPDVGEAITWLCDAYGFNLRLRIGNHRAQLSVGDGAIVVTSGDTRSAGIHACSIMVRVANVDHHCQHTSAYGAEILLPLADHPYGERQYVTRDLAGHRWTFSQSIADVDPAAWGGTLL